MKTLSYLLLSLILISSGIHATIVEDIINKQVSAIIEKGAQKNILPNGAYYLYALSNFEEINKNNKTKYQVKAVVKNLNNRTKISFSGLFDENLESLSYLYNYSFFNGAKGLSPWNMGFHWLDYASSPNSTYCPPQDFSENAFNWYIAPVVRKTVVMIPQSNVNTSSNFQDLKNYALLATQGNYLPPSAVWFAPSIDELAVTFFNNYYLITYIFGSDSYQEDYWDFKVDTLYQPCSGQKAALYTYQGSSVDDWHDNL